MAGVVSTGAPEIPPAAKSEPLARVFASRQADHRSLSNQEKLSSRLSHRFAIDTPWFYGLESCSSLTGAASWICTEVGSILTSSLVVDSSFFSSHLVHLELPVASIIYTFDGRSRVFAIWYPTDLGIHQGLGG